MTVQTTEPRWGRLSHEFVVAEGEGPLDLGKLELMPRFWPKAKPKKAEPAKAEN